MKDWFKHNFKYFFLFLFFFFCLQFVYTSYEMDTYANYAFSYGLVKGQIPYVDYSLIIPLFSPFLYSLGLYFSHSLLVLYLEQALFLVIFSHLLFKILHHKTWLFLLLLLLPWPISFVYAIYPGYNFLVFFFFCLLIYLEDNASDKIIGIVLGLLILTKHTIGILFLIANLLYHHKDIKRFGTRLFYALIPLSIFFIYLLLTKSVSSFIDMCFLGLFTFSSHNNYLSIPYLILVLIACLILIILSIRQKISFNISYLYLLMYLTIIYPIVDDYHCSLFLLAALFLFLYNFPLNMQSPKHLQLLSCILMLILSCSWLFITTKTIKDLHVYHLPNFPFKILTKTDKKNTDKLLNYLQDKKYILLLGHGKNVFFTILNDQKLTHYTNSNNGNHGYNGTQKMLQKIAQEHHQYIVIDTSLDCSTSQCQYMQELEEYVKTNAKLVKNIAYYNIYYLE